MSDSGAPTKYKSEYDQQVYKLCLLGATDVQLADFFGVCEKTIHNWAAEEPEFKAARRRGKMIADAEVSNSLYQRANGYSHPEEKIFCQDGQIVRANTTRHYPPETIACIFWLKNRQPEDWRDKTDIDHGGKVEIVRIIDDVPRK